MEVVEEGIRGPPTGGRMELPGRIALPVNERPESVLPGYVEGRGVYRAGPYPGGLDPVRLAYMPCDMGGAGRENPLRGAAEKPPLKAGALRPENPPDGAEKPACEPEKPPPPPCDPPPCCAKAWQENQATITATAARRFMEAFYACLGNCGEGRELAFWVSYPTRSW